VVERIRELTSSMRVLLVAAGVLVFLAGVQLFLFPLRTERYFSWTIDVPMTAVFLGASYWSSLVFEWSAARRTRWVDARIAVPTVFVFTTLTLVATLVHRDKFHFGSELEASTRAVTWIWTAIYAVVPIAMVVLMVVQSRQPGVDPPRTRPLAAWIRVVIALEALLLLGGGAYQPVHWGTFRLALQAWDEPVETLLALGPPRGAQLLLPRLGEAVEPAHFEAPTPWWRAVDAIELPAEPPVEAPAMTLPKSMPWPVD
jgi:hypothetical protein